MQAYRVETTIQQDGSLVVRDLPLRAGEEVEEIILVRPPLKSTFTPLNWQSERRNIYLRAS